jgi:hypothetical protein
LLLRLGVGEQADLDEVQGADQPVADTEAVGLDDGVAQRDGPVVFEQDQRGG